MLNQLHSFFEKNIITFDKFFYQQKNKLTRRNFLSVVFSIFLALLISFIIVTALGTRPTAFFLIFTKIFAWGYDAERFAVQISIYVLAALAFSFSMRVGIFNIGISGQMLAGASTAFLIILSIDENSIANFGNGAQFLTMFFAILGALSVALLTGVLKIYFKVNEVVSAILLNWTILYIVGAIFSDPAFQDVAAFNNGSFQSKPLPTAFSFWQPGDFFGWHWSIGITLVAVIVIWLLLKFTVFGHKLKTTGQNPFAAKNFGYNQNLIQLWAFAISGILSGLLATVVYTASFNHVLIFQNVGNTALNALPPEGFDGIAIGLISLNNPLVIGLVAIVFSFPNVGAAPSNLPSSTIALTVGIMMYLIAIYRLLIYFQPWRSYVKYYYGKVNLINYQNLENGIFEIAENYQFDVQLAMKDYYDHKFANKPVYHYWLFKLFMVHFDKQWQNNLASLKQTYKAQRLQLTTNFKKECLQNLLTYWQEFVKTNKPMHSWHKKLWQKDLKLLTKWGKQLDQEQAFLQAVDFQTNLATLTSQLNNRQGGASNA